MFKAIKSRKFDKNHAGSNCQKIKRKKEGRIDEQWPAGLMHGHMDVSTIRQIGKDDRQIPVFILEGRYGSIESLFFQMTPF